MFIQLDNPRVWDIYHEGTLSNPRKPVTLRAIERRERPDLSVGFKFDSKDELIKFLKQALAQCEMNPEDQYVRKAGS